MKLKTALALLVFGCYSAGEILACTIGVAHGVITTDGRPILWKNRDNRPVRQQRLSYYPANEPGEYAFIGVHTVDGGPTMGLNEAGLAAGNSRGNDTGTYIRNTSLQLPILHSCANTDEVHERIVHQMSLDVDHPDHIWISGCFPFIDARGEAVMYEISKSRNERIGIWHRVYNATNTNRKAQNLFGLVPRANTFHKTDDGTDNTSFRDHYMTCRVNTQGLVERDILSPLGIIQGSPDREFEVLRYSHYGSARDIARWWTFSAIVVHGVLPDEDPALSTMWTLLGKPDYCIAVPAWAKVSLIPEVLAEGKMWDRAESLYKKGERDVVHAAIVPAELHIFDMVNNVLLPYWRANGMPSEEEVTRVQHRIVKDAYSLLDCLDNRRNNNRPPEISRIDVDLQGLKADFSADANDPDGEIVDWRWDFGDGNRSEEQTPRHTFAHAGTYLVSCSVRDNDGVSITSWRYVAVGADD